MPVETATFLSDLNPSNPAHTDQLNQDDAHMRLVKTTLKNTFPNFTAAALQASQAELDAVAHTGQVAAQDGGSGTPSITFKNDATAGFRKGSRAGQVQIEGSLRGSGSVPCGALVDFPKVPPRFSLGGAAAGGAAAIDYLEQDGSVYNISDFPDLGAFLGNTYGGNGTTTFGVPNVKDTGRFRRSRTASVAAGTYQSSQNLAHTHVTDTSGAHTHVATVNDPQHNHPGSVPSQPLLVSAGSSFSVWGASNLGNTSNAATGITVSIDTEGAHTHNVLSSGGSEARPESFVVVACIKT